MRISMTSAALMLAGSIVLTHATQVAAQGVTAGQCEAINEDVEAVKAGIEAAFRLLPPDIEKLGADGDVYLAGASIRSALSNSTVLTAADATEMTDILLAIAAAVSQLYPIQDAAKDFNIDC